MSMRLVIMGTGPFAVPMLEAIYSSPHRVAALVTRPARNVHGRRAPVSPMRALAEAHGTPVLDPEDVNDESARDQLARCAPELLLAADYGQILAPDTLSVAARGGVNLHGSLLPKYRGAAPINWAIYYGETRTGVTVIQMMPRCDAGPCLARAETSIDPEETAVELEARLARMGAELIIKTLDEIESDQTRPLVQDATLATRAPKLKKSDGAVDWTRSAVAIKNHVRAMRPWPGTYTFWRRPEKEPLRLILDRVAVLPETANAAPGAVVTASDGHLHVATGEGTLAIEKAQPAGKKLLRAEQLLRGYPIQVGEMFGPSER